MPNIVEFEIPATESVTSESRQFALAANVITPRESVEIYDVEGAGLLLCVSFIPDDGNLGLFSNYWVRMVNEPGLRVTRLTTVPAQSRYPLRVARPRLNCPILR